MSDGTTLEALPDDATELHTLATTASTFPYEREAAIKKLATLEGADAESLLSSLATGDALTPVEEDLAAARIDDHDA